MPSKAANAVDSQPAPVSSGSGRNSVTDNPNETNALPQQILAIVQHKWRNLEKRKKKLDDYKRVGETNLKADQREALSHFGEVVQLLELLSEMKKQFESTFSEHETLLKRQAKAEKNAQRKRDVERMRDILDVRFVLNSLGDDTLRNELLQNDKVSEAELTLIDKFYESVEPTSSACVAGKVDPFLTGATDCFERLLRKEEKIFYEKHSYAQLRSILSRLYQTLTEAVQENSHQVAERQEEQQASKVEQVVAENTEGFVKPHQENLTEYNTRMPPPSPQKQNLEQHVQQEKDTQQVTNLEEIVKPGNFSFLQESQITFGGAQHHPGGLPREFVNSNADQQIGTWVPPVEKPTETDTGQVWSNRSGGAIDAPHPEPHGGGRPRSDRSGGRQQQRTRKHYNAGGGDENNEAAATGWPQNDADYSQWKPDDVGAGASRGDTGGWIGQESRRRGGGGGSRGGRGGFHRPGGQNSGQQFGDNRRHFNRGPRPGGSSMQQSRSAAVGGGSGGFAE